MMCICAAQICICTIFNYCKHASDRKIWNKYFNSYKAAINFFTLCYNYVNVNPWSARSPRNSITLELLIDDPVDINYQLANRPIHTRTADAIDCDDCTNPGRRSAWWPYRGKNSVNAVAHFRESRGHGKVNSISIKSIEATKACRF